MIIDDTSAAAAVEPQQQPQQIVKNYVAVAKPRDQVIDRRYIDMQLEIQRETDLIEYFKEPAKPMLLS